MSELVFGVIHITDEERNDRYFRMNHVTKDIYLWYIDNCDLFFNINRRVD